MYEDCALQSMRFPQKLWKIVNECESGAIRWGANGDTILLDYKRFQAEYLDARRPIFKTNNITSFIRQLNLYGFRKVTYHGREPTRNSYNLYVHEFLHENFRADRTDLLAKVCRKTTGKSKCFQRDAAKSAENSPRLEAAASHVSRLKLCQLALTKTLEQITQEYRREHEERSNVVKNNTLKNIGNSQNIVPGFHENEYNSSNRNPTMEQSAKYSVFFPSKTALLEGKIISSCWRMTTMNKCNLHFNIRDNN